MTSPPEPPARSLPGSPQNTHPLHALSFDAVAAQYAAARPGYPPRLFDTVELLAGRPLAGADVVDVGAGTGIATRLLRGRGARVTAVEPGAAMAAQLHAALPDVPLIRGDGNDLPLTDESADLVTYAQSWHWTDPVRSVPEALRVLRPGGALVVWWNVPDPDVPWAAEQEARLARRLPGYHAKDVAPHADAIIEGLGLGIRPVRTRLHWTRKVSLGTHLAMLGSRSHLIVIGPEHAGPVLQDERAELLRLFPDGIVEEAYAVDVTVTLRPAASSSS
ncbi:class I SAM-dependent methyltransferase [Streptomyces sp. 8N616]|uniref:class I SAM-dependent methyltransferase n=1 Tax=Streptomyces sp. 8N616 TaxID=3457414 RepID=UPI003FCFDCD9